MPSQNYRNHITKIKSPGLTENKKKHVGNVEGNLFCLLQHKCKEAIKHNTQSAYTRLLKFYVMSFSAER